MRYILLSFNGEKPIIDSVTEDPTGLVTASEPIDIINGKLEAWDMEGNLYHFATDSSVDVGTSNGFFSTVNVGRWKEGEPKLVQINKNGKDALRAILIEWLSDRRHEKKHWWSRRKEQPLPYSLDFSVASLDDLIEEIEHALEQHKTKT